MIKSDSVRVTITIKKDQLKVLDDTIKEVNKKSTYNYNRSSMLVTSFFALFGAMQQESQNKSKEDKK